MSRSEAMELSPRPGFEGQSPINQQLETRQIIDRHEAGERIDGQAIGTLTNEHILRAGRYFDAVVVGQEQTGLGKLGPATLFSINTGSTTGQTTTELYAYVPKIDLQQPGKVSGWWCKVQGMTPEGQVLVQQGIPLSTVDVPIGHRTPNAEGKYQREDYAIGGQLLSAPCGEKTLHAHIQDPSADVRLVKADTQEIAQRTLAENFMLGLQARAGYTTTLDKAGRANLQPTGMLDGDVDGRHAHLHVIPCSIKGKAADGKTEITGFYLVTQRERDGQKQVVIAQATIVQEGGNLSFAFANTGQKNIVMDLPETMMTFESTPAAVAHAFKSGNTQARVPQCNAEQTTLTFYDVLHITSEAHKNDPTQPHEH